MEKGLISTIVVVVTERVIFTSGVGRVTAKSVSS